MEKKLNKLDALRILGNAYHYLGSDSDAGEVLNDCFGYIRRSLRLPDLKPQPRNTEGLNGRGPHYF
jgi:hypothetical protein